MAFLYPWGNTQQLNLDWILQKIKELEAGSGGADLDEVANALIGASYARQAYEQFDIVFHDGKLYLANTDIAAPGETWTPEHWDEILLGGPVSALLKHVTNLSSDNVINDSQVPGDTVSDALDTIKDTIVNLSFDSDSVGNESSVAGDNVSDALETLDADILQANNNIAFVEAGTTASRTYMTNRFVIVGGQLYKTKAIVNNGDTFINGTNIEPLALSSMLEAISITTDITVDSAHATDVVGRRYGNLVVLSGGLLASSGDAAAIVSNIPRVAGIALAITMINSSGLPLTTGGVWLERNQSQLNFYGSCPSQCSFQVIYMTDE